MSHVLEIKLYWNVLSEGEVVLCLKPARHGPVWLAMARQLHIQSSTVTRRLRQEDYVCTTLQQVAAPIVSTPAAVS
ncbi:hypothetical protein E2C01_003904 [Portunus trituberculatus]|uniref:Uncharacterized protein n=1 Tax=Portunus trituberculatus TaxID=210409 RepID=A0A5B7CNG7_PORTR|nr:hypothetical protein [Portunus trituberculatus]